MAIVANKSAWRSKLFGLPTFMTKVVPTIAYYYNSLTETMGRGTTSKRNKPTPSDKSDSASSSDGDGDSRGEDERESGLHKEAKRRRHLIDEDKHNNKKSPPPSSPDHTYKTSDEEENSDQERECDMELENMLPCRGAKELQPSSEDGDYIVDNDDYVVPAGKHGLTSSGGAQNWEGTVRVRGMSARESSMSKNYQENIADRVTTYVRKDLFRVVKFISNEHMFGKAFKEVMDHECVANQDRVKFQMLYESVFNHALNSKRSTCEQAGRGIMLRELKNSRTREWICSQVTNCRK